MLIYDTGAPNRTSSTAPAPRRPGAREPGRLVLGCAAVALLALAGAALITVRAREPERAEPAAAN